MSPNLKALEKRLIREYNSRAKTVNAGVLARTQNYDRAFQIMRSRLKGGAITSTEYRTWLRRELLHSAWSRDVANFVNGELMSMNRVANELITAEREASFIYGYNNGLFEIEKGLKVETTFNILNEQTMARLIADNPTLLPQARQFAWGSRRVQSALVQSMIKGESARGLAKRLETAVNMDKVSAIRNARTMLTSCENAGRVEMAMQAEEKGIKLKKVWLATLDERTRESHREMDGVKVGVDEPFVLTNNDGSESELMYPADPNGDPEQVYNCRCTLIYDVNNSLKSVDPAIINRRSNIENYDNWKNRRR